MEIKCDLLIEAFINRANNIKLIACATTNYHWPSTYCFHNSLHSQVYNVYILPSKYQREINN